MSIIIDLLKPRQDNNDYETQERLAETYFPSSGKKAKEFPDSPQGAKKKSLSRPGIRNALALIAISISILSLSAILFYIFSTQALTIDITVSKKGHLPYENLLNTERVNLFGGATEQKGYVSLANGATKRRAGLIIDLEKPLDLSSKYLLISIWPKLKTGRLKVIFRDKNHRSFVSNMFDIREIKKEGQNLIVPVKNFKESIDMRNIQHIRLELENSVSEDIEESEVYIKEVALINN